MDPAQREGDRIAPASFPQQRLWFLDQWEPGSPFYNLARAVRLTGPLDVVVLERSLQEIVRRHEALRTTFAAVDGQPVQVISRSLRLEIPLADLTVHPESEHASRISEMATAEARRPFDLSKGPLLRAMLLRLGSAEHVLILTLHHIISDGWSIGVLNRELSTLYAAFSARRESPLAELPIQYAEYATCQREWLQGDRLEQQLAYWSRQLANAPVLELPTDRPRPATQTFRGSARSFGLPRGVGEALTRFARQERVTPFMVLLAIFQVLLARYTGQDDIAVGVPIAGRNRADLEGLIGCFVNTLVLRTNLSGNPNLLELVRRVREVALSAYAHQEVPFEKLVEELKPTRDLSRTPLFQVMLTLQNAPNAPLDLPGVKTERLHALDMGAAKFDLTFHLFDETADLRGSVAYNSDLFDRPTIDRMVGHFGMLLESALAAPEQPFSRWPMLVASERHQLVMEWNASTRQDSADECLHEPFERQAVHVPDAVAVVSGDERLTYRDLNGRANRLAHYLRRLGAGPEVRVGICLERSSELVVGLLGILKAGAAYVPLDPCYPHQRIRFMLEDAGVRLLLTQERFLEALRESHCAVACVDRDRALIEEESGENFDSDVSPDNLAYVLYTSGSTGVPKGVAVSHRSTRALLAWAKGVFEGGDLENVLAATSICFDLSVFELFVPLTSGGTVLLADSILQLPSLPAAAGVTLINTVPSAMAALLRVGGVPASVRTVNLAGEALSAGLVDELYRRTSVRRVFDLYGPSETTTYSTWALREEGAAATIGRPIANTQVYVLDRHGEPLPIAVPGELYIGGAGLARCYFNRPELTAERYLPDPFSGVHGARLYRTGDRARYRPDGTLEFLGRLDQQIKLRGFRIELGEIETVLAEHPAVSAAAVSSQNDAAGETRLLAYVVSDTTAPIEELRASLAARLPAYMVPSALIQVEALPLTPTGKVDRQALPAIDSMLLDREVVYVAPRTPLEEKLAAVWSDVLKLERVGVNDDFFLLGGHSLLAMQLVARMRELLEVELPLRHLFEYPTIAAIAEIIAQMPDRVVPSEPAAVPTAIDTGPAQLPAEQQKINRLLTELEELSDDEARELLERYRRQTTSLK